MLRRINIVSLWPPSRVQINDFRCHDSWYWKSHQLVLGPFSVFSSSLLNCWVSPHLNTQNAKSEPNKRLVQVKWRPMFSRCGLEKFALRGQKNCCPRLNNTRNVRQD